MKSQQLLFSALPLIPSVFSAESMVHYQTDGNTYDSFITSVAAAEHVVFGVKACQEARLALTEIPGITTRTAYEVTIGAQDNTKCSIASSVRGDIKQEVACSGALSCDNIKYFWISWHDGRVEVGMDSTVGSRRMMTWTPPGMHTINAVSVMTPEETRGTWEFRVNQGQCKLNSGYLDQPVIHCCEILHFLHKNSQVEISTTSTLPIMVNTMDMNMSGLLQESRYRCIAARVLLDCELMYGAILTITLLNHQVITFDVVACNDAHIVLATYYKTVYYPDAYEIVIGSYGNSHVEIRDGAGVSTLELHNSQHHV